MMVSFSVTIGIFVFRASEADLLYQKGSEAQTAASTLAATLDSREVQTILETEEKTEYYESLRETIARVGERMPYIAYTYVLSMREPHFFTIFGQSPDANIVHELGFLFPLEIWNEASIRSHTEGIPTFSTPYYVPGYGHLLSGYAPIFYGSDNVIAIVGFDFDASYVIEELTTFRNNIIIIIAVFLLASLIITHLIISLKIGKPLTLLCEASNEIAMGNMNVSIPSGENDEIGVLAESFAQVQKEVSALVDEVIELGRATVSGHLYTRADESEFQGSFREVVGSVNYIIDNTILYLDNVHATVTIIDEDYNTIFLNKAANKQGFTKENAIGKSHHEVFGKEEADELIANLEKAKNTREIVRRIVNLTTPNGQSVTEEHVIVPVKDKSEKIIAFLIMCTDISKMVQAQQKIEQANHAKTNFLFKISHEIRTPMNAIMSMANLVLREDICEQARRHAVTIKRSGDHLLSLVNDLLDLSKVETGKLELSPARYELASLIHDAMQLNITLIGSKPIELILELDESLPAMLYGDELRIKQVLNNFLSNAIKYTSEGYVKLGVKSFKSDTDTLLQFIIEDTGQGIRHEDLKNLFSAYTRFNTDSNRFVEGTGIGLTIADSLIRMMGGNIEVKSEIGKGSIFTATIKQQSVDSQTIGRELAEQLCNFSFTLSGKNDQVDFEPMPYGRVLVVDDVEINLYVVKELLAPYRVSVDFAANGLEALDKVSSDISYDIIFMDQMMPEMDGIEATKKMRDDGYAGTIIALTANALVGNAEMFKSKGFDGFISKPIDLGSLDFFMKRYVRDKH